MRTVVATLAAVIAVIVIAGAALIYTGSYYVGADKPYWPTMAWLFNEARDRSIRSHAAGVTEPSGLNDPVKIVARVSHYSEQLRSLPRAPGSKRGDLADGLVSAAARSSWAVRVYMPSELFWIIKHGIRMTGMLAWADHGDYEQWRPSPSSKSSPV